MIFVTVGTTYFDELVAEVDRLKRAGIIRDSVIAQIGAGKYIPTECEWLRYTGDIDAYFRDADLIIGHGGTGTVFDLLETGKPFIAVANRALKDDHQTEFLKAVSTLGWCRCCLRLEELATHVTERSLLPRYINMRPLAPAVWRFLGWGKGP